jgi:polyhydroxybutyrate depolymerase
MDAGLPAAPRGATVRAMRRAILLAVITAACGGGGGGKAGPDAGVLGGDRPVKLQVPPDVQPGQKYPLVLILHGYGANGYVQQAVLQMRDLPTFAHAFVLAPDGTVDSAGKAFWNADPVCCDMDHTGVDDVKYLGGLIDTVMAQQPIDPARVFVVGHSNGGFMAFRMACARADVITAIADLAGAAPSDPSTCNPVKPVASLHVHGTADDMVAYAGADLGNGLHLPGAKQTVAEWAGKIGCTGALVDGGTIDIETYLAGAETQESSTSGCPAPAAADLWTINGGSHLPDLAPSFGTDVWAWLDAHARTP